MLLLANVHRSLYVYLESPSRFISKFFARFLLRKFTPILLAGLFRFFLQISCDLPRKFTSIFLSGLFRSSSKVRLSLPKGESKKDTMSRIGEYFGWFFDTNNQDTFLFDTKHSRERLATKVPFCERPKFVPMKSGENSQIFVLLEMGMKKRLNLELKIVWI